MVRLATYVSRLKKETGMTISNYIAQQRVGEIESYLIFTQKSLTEIAIDLGFHDLSYLTKTFKKSGYHFTYSV
ncbi:helix-turn-helix domain-containing protein [Lentilactobacillus kisonensis]|uniref:helix-turn-helix domain-containing protein n=1 Tax=Lentilactobacillus kisonensis TaxID=481722 RepID=UPI0024363173|nr:helix-turn-helix domain-containing protein [Lentilactobacillus kisonensis]